MRCEVGGEYNSRVAASSCASSFLVRRRDRGQQGREYSMPSNNEDAGHKQRNWKEGKIKMFPPIAVPAGKLCNFLIIEFVFI